MSPARLAEIRAAVEKATPGPWLCEPDTDEPCAAFWLWRQTGERIGEQVPCEGIPHLETNATFIALARSAVPELLAELSALWERHHRMTCVGCKAGFGEGDEDWCGERNPYAPSREC